jgi:tRNA A37 threonylcarbamoyltransferase TsaD
MDIALALVSLSDKQVRHVSSDVVLIAGGVAAKYFLKPIL